MKNFQTSLNLIRIRARMFFPANKNFNVKLNFQRAKPMED